MKIRKRDFNHTARVKGSVSFVEKLFVHTTPSPLKFDRPSYSEVGVFHLISLRRAFRRRRLCLRSSSDTWINNFIAYCDRLRCAFFAKSWLSALWNIKHFFVAYFNLFNVRCSFFPQPTRARYVEPIAWIFLPPFSFQFIFHELQHHNKVVITIKNVCWNLLDIIRIEDFFGKCSGCWEKSLLLPRSLHLTCWVKTPKISFSECSWKRDILRGNNAPYKFFCKCTTGEVKEGICIRL